ncbi:histidine phosphatase family protein [Holzapfeliella floricola]|uniref:Phosphoglycerate mutase n=1 Tax=Holzapfeliella floricola DSM 23037 = JCM 16512 TaxID=1423744 RepID=A0A0R2DRW6_9LACO|nr:histidine phosphatase family protein [Holzapfeliella floricola]KRN03607.1 phosphoglycerate mutase [Holzapfeliella floricola DSM 23037 = JCM 16512]
MKLYLIRHGKTEWNLERRYQGANGDSPLLPQSYEDIKQLASFIKGISFDALFTSPLKRTITTSKELLKALNQTQVLITEDDRLKEFGLGDLEGRTFTECSKNYPSQIKAFRENPAIYDPSAFGGETFQSVIARGNQFIKEILAQYGSTDANILIISHGAALNAIIKSQLHVPLADMRKDGGLANTSLSILENKNSSQEFECLMLNNTSYLTKKPEKSDTV